MCTPARALGSSMGMSLWSRKWPHRGEGNHKESFADEPVVANNIERC